MNVSRAVACPFDEVDAATPRAASPAANEERRAERSPRVSAASSSDGLPAYGSGFGTPDALDVEKGGWPKEKPLSSESLLPAAGPSAAPQRTTSLGARFLRAIGQPLRAAHERQVEAPRRLDAVVAKIQDLIEQGKVAQRARDWETAIFLYESAFAAYEANNIQARKVEPFFGSPLGRLERADAQPVAVAQQKNLLWQAFQQDDNSCLVSSLLKVLWSQRRHYGVLEPLLLIPQDAMPQGNDYCSKYFFWTTRTALMSWVERQAHGIVELLCRGDDESAVEQLEPLASTISLAIETLSQQDIRKSGHSFAQFLRAGATDKEPAHFLSKSIAATLFPGVRTNPLEDGRVSCESLLDLLRKKSLHKTLDFLNNSDKTIFFQKSSLKAYLSHTSELAANGDYHEAIVETARLFVAQLGEESAARADRCLEYAHGHHANRLLGILRQLAKPLAPADLQPRQRGNAEAAAPLVLRLGPPGGDSPPWFRFALLVRLKPVQIEDVNIDPASGTITQVRLPAFADSSSYSTQEIGRDFRTGDEPSLARFATKHWLQLAFETGNGVAAARLNAFDFGPGLSQDLLSLLRSTPHRSQAIAFFDELLPEHETAPVFLRAEVLREPSIRDILPPHLKRWLTP